MFRLFLIAALTGAPMAMAEPAETSLIIRSGDGSEHVFSMELADEPEERSRGLMQRESLSAMSGMLFDFGRSDHVGMWMKDTLIALDMLFVASSGEIVSIAERARPGSLRRIASGAPVRGVVEIAGGEARRLGIRPGDMAIHDIFSGDE